MGIIVLLISVSLTIAVVFLLVFCWSMKSGQYDDTYTPSIRMLFDDKKDGDKKKEKDHGTYQMNNFRYGLRLQLGFKDTDLFFNYDLNELFVSGKGPKLNAFSFGVSF